MFLLLFSFSCTNTTSREKINNSGDYQRKILEINENYEISNNTELDLSSRKNYINLAYKFILEVSNDSLKNKVLYQKAFLHYKLKEFDSLIHYLNKFDNQITFSNNFFKAGNANFLRAYYLSKVPVKNDSAFYYYNKSKNYFLASNDSLQVGNCLINMAYLQEHSADYFGGKETATEALEFLMSSEENKNVALVYNVLAICNKKLLNYKAAITNYKLAVEFSSSKEKKIGFANNLATVYVESKDYAKAVSLLDSILEDSISFSDVKLARSLDNLAYVKWKKDSSVNVINQFSKALKIRKSKDDRLGLLASNTHLGEYYSKSDKIKAINFFKKALEISKAIKRPKGELDALKFLMELKPNNVTLKERYIYLSDSLKRQELNVKTQFAHIKYLDQQKTEQLLRQTNLAKQREIELLKEKEQKSLYLFSGIVLILSIFFYVKYQKVKHKNEKIDSIYKTREALAKTVHDEVANEINSLSNFVETNAHLNMASNNNLLKNKLHDIYLKARDISTDNTCIDFSNFKDELNNLLIQYKPYQIQLITNLAEFEWEKIENFKKGEIYLVLQELLVNAKKHSKATIITLMLSDNKNYRTITYKDNGIGLNLKTVKLNGLKNAENRIKNINGIFNFTSTVGKGLLATIVFKI